MTIRAGALRHRVELQKNVTSENEFGEEEENWVVIDTVWAGIEEQETGEMDRETDQTRVQETDTEITIRYQEDVNETMRVVDTDSGNEYDIQAVANQEMKDHELKLLCRKR